MEVDRVKRDIDIHRMNCQRIGGNTRELDRMKEGLGKDNEGIREDLHRVEATECRQTY